MPLFETRDETTKAASVGVGVAASCAASRLMLGVASLSVVGLVVFDGLIAAAILERWIGGMAGLLGHVLCAAGLLVAMGRLAALDGADETLPVMAGLGLLVAGPPGALLAALSLVGVKPAAEGSSAVSAWLAGMKRERSRSAAQEVYEAIASGRSQRTGLGAPVNFHRIIAEGTLREAQAVLGHVGLQYHPDYRSVLDAALRSPRAGLRVQAAAVHAKLRGEIAGRLRNGLSEVTALQGNGPEPHRLAAALDTLRECRQSGFLDGAECRRVAACLVSVSEVLTDSAQQLPRDVVLALMRALDSAGEHGPVLWWLTERSDLCDAETGELRLRALMKLKRFSDLRAALPARARERAPSWPGGVLDGALAAVVRGG